VGEAVGTGEAVGVAAGGMGVAVGVALHAAAASRPTSSIGTSNRASFIFITPA
jgi:hypothetical protein